MADPIDSNAEDMQFKYGIPREEVDVPLKKEDGKGIEEPLDTKKLEIAEKDKDRRDKRYFRAFNLIVGCLVFLSIVYLVDVIAAGVLKQDLSSVTDGVIEIIKTLLFTLSGYLFARKENGD